jgi:hypothetical protein
MIMNSLPNDRISKPKRVGMLLNSISNDKCII